MIKKLTKYSISLFISLIITWGIGLIVITHNQYIDNTWTLWFFGLINITFAVGLFHLIISPIALLGRRYKITPIIIHILYCSILLLEILSLFYFSITLHLLGRTIFEFSMDQSLLIIKSYFVFKWYYLLIPSPIIIYFILNRIHFFEKRLGFYSLLCIGVISIVIGFHIQPKGIPYSNLSDNKTIHFIQSIYSTPTHFHNNGNLSEDDITFYQKSINPLLKNKKYLLYRPVYQTNPLAPFFDLKETPPNLVIIVVESLSSSFSGPNADEISYTPFLDSLAQHSLYFTNFLSTADRSFAALPSILGSLPHGEKGFINSKSGYPKNETLPTWLFRNGYTGDFHYGGYARMGHLDLFMNNQGFKNIYDRKEYDYEGNGSKGSNDSIPFGISDKPFFKSIVKAEDSRKSKAPFLDVYFTLSMHYPYIIENHEYYYKKVKRTIKNADVDEKIKDKNRKYVDELATFLYTDDALKWYFNQEKKKKHYKNTVYVIVGDHMMGEIAQSSDMEKYRPALMVFSPLLKRHKFIKGTNSHLDIAPSFYQLLEHQYDFTALDSVSWLGQPFDTSSVFHSNRDVLFMLNDATTQAILHNDYFLSRDKLYTVSDHLRITPSANKEKLEFMRKLFTVSTAVHDDVVTQNLIIPSNGGLELLAHKNDSLYIDKSIEYESVYKTVLQQSYKRVLFEMNAKFSGDWTPDDNDKNNPILVYTLQRGDSTLSWDYVNLKLARTGVKTEKDYRFLISSNLDYDLKAGDKIKVFFWNKAMSNNRYRAKIQSFKVKGEH